MNKNTAVYQGTFDPFTNGHLAVLKDARALFSEIIVLLLVNPNKSPLFSQAQRMQLVRAAVQEAGLDAIRVVCYEGLLAEYMRAQGLSCCVRGIRNGRDAEFELENHRLSQTFYPSLQTWLLPSRPEYQDISSSAVKAACAAGRLPAKWVPASVAEALRGKYPSLEIF